MARVDDGMLEAGRSAVRHDVGHVDGAARVLPVPERRVEALDQVVGRLAIDRVAVPLRAADLGLHRGGVGTAFERLDAIQERVGVVRRQVQPRLVVVETLLLAENDLLWPVALATAGDLPEVHVGVGTVRTDLSEVHPEVLAVPDLLDGELLDGHDDRLGVVVHQLASPGVEDRDRRSGERCLRQNDLLLAEHRDLLSVGCEPAQGEECSECCTDEIHGKFSSRFIHSTAL